MPRFQISFCVEQFLSGSIDVEAETRAAAADRFYRGDYDEARLGATLELQDSEDAIVEVAEISCQVESQPSPH